MLLTILLLWVVLWVGSILLLPDIIRNAIPQLAVRVKPLGVELTDSSFSFLHVSPLFNHVEMKDFQAGFDLNPKDKIELKSQIRIQKIGVGLQNLFSMRGVVRGSGIEVRFDESDLPASIPFDRFTNGEVMMADFPLIQPRKAAKEILQGLEELFRDNEVVGAFRFSGDVKLSVENVETKAHLYTERSGDRFRLRFRAQDIEMLAKKMQVNLVPEQVEIVSLYPLRVPLLMLITDAARDRAHQHEPNDVWLRDAHRHVTWSYLLTKHFDADFAQQVTDAQELNPGNTENERAMDFHNNAVGRKLFTKGVDEASLPRIIREDPNVIRHPNEVPSLADRLLR